MLGTELFLSVSICLYSCATNSFEKFFPPVGWMTALGWEHLLKWPQWYKVILTLWYLIYLDDFYGPSQNHIKGWLFKEHLAMSLLSLPKICQTSSKRAGDSAQAEWGSSAHAWHWKPMSVGPKTEAKLERKQFISLDYCIPPCLITSAFADPPNV